MKTKFKSLIALLLVIALSLTLAACGSSSTTSSPTPEAESTTSGAATPTEEPAQTFEVVVAASAEPESLDPQLAGASAGGNISYNIFDYLVRMNQDGTELIPSLATDWEQVDELTWRFYLREGVTFTDGEPFNADAVAFTLDRIFEADSGRTTYNLKVIDSWNVVDDYTIDIVTASPCNDMPIRLYDMAILPPEYCEEVGDDQFGVAPVGCGPYKLSEWSTNNYIELVANEDYWGDAPTCTKITFRTIPEISTRLSELMAGTVDIVTDLNPDYIETVNSYDGYSVATALSKRVAYIGLDLLNEDSPVELQDVRVRQALNYAIDRDTIVENIFLGNANVLSTIWRADYVGYSDDLSSSSNAYPYDPEKAIELLTEAGYPDGFTLDLYYSSAIFLKASETAQAVAGYLEDIGITVNLHEMEYNAIRAALINGQEAHQIKGAYTWNWGSKPQTPDGHLAGAVETGGITSYYSNSDVDELIEKVRYTLDETERAEYAQELQELLYEDCPYIFLWQQVDVYGISDGLNWTPRLDQYILGTDMSLAD